MSTMRSVSRMTLPWSPARMPSSMAAAATSGTASLAAVHTIPDATPPTTHARCGRIVWAMRRQPARRNERSASAASRSGVGEDTAGRGYPGPVGCVPGLTGRGLRDRRGRERLLDHAGDLVADELVALEQLVPQRLHHHAVRVEQHTHGLLGTVEHRLDLVTRRVVGQAPRHEPAVERTAATRLEADERARHAERADHHRGGRGRLAEVAAGTRARLPEPQL